MMRMQTLAPDKEQDRNGLRNMHKLRLSRSVRTIKRENVRHSALVHKRPEVRIVMLWLPSGCASSFRHGGRAGLRSILHFPFHCTHTPFCTGSEHGTTEGALYELNVNWAKLKTCGFKHTKTQEDSQRFLTMTQTTHRSKAGKHSRNTRTVRRVTRPLPSCTNNFSFAHL